MGGSKTGLVSTIGVTLLNPDGTVHTARATAGIHEIGDGCYGKEITFPDNWSGIIKWDTGGGSPVYATEEYVVEGLADKIEEDTSKMNFSGNNIQARVADKGILNNPPSESINDYKADVGNLDVAVSTRSSHADPTGAIKGAPGKTIQEAYDNEKGTDGAYTGTPPTVGEIRTEIEKAGTKVTTIKTQTDKMKFTGDDIKATLDGEKVALSDATETQIDDIETDLNSPNQYKADVSALALENSGRLQNVEVDTNEMQGKLPDDKIAGSSDATSLESKHGSGSWEGGVIGGDWGVEERKQIRDALGVDGTKKEALGGGIQAIIEHLIDIKGTGWTDETLKAIKEYVDELETGDKPPKKKSFDL